MMHESESKEKRKSFGTSKTTWVDSFGVWLSQVHIRRARLSKTPLKVADIGSGFNATNLRTFSSIANELCAVDFNLNPELLKDTRFKNFEGNVEESPNLLGTSDFDLILMISVLEHFKDDVKMLLWAHQNLSEKGSLIINVPTWIGKVFLEFSAFKLGLSPAEEMEDHKRYYSTRELWPVLVKAGFLPSKIRMKYTKFGLNLFAVATK
jgi:SAM-dependent methyltransferase